MTRAWKLFHYLIYDVQKPLCSSGTMRIYYEAWLFVQLQGDMVVALLALSCTVLGGFFFSTHQPSLPLHRLPSLSTTNYETFIGRKGCAEVSYTCPVHPPKSFSFSDSGLLSTSCVSSDAIFTSHLFGLKLLRSWASSEVFDGLVGQYFGPL